MIDRVIIYRDDTRQFRWRRESAGNWETVGASSEAYTRVGGCQENVERTNGPQYVDGQKQYDVITHLL